MMKIVFSVFLFSLMLSRTAAQSLPVGTSVLEDYYRNSQLSGKLDPAISFTVRPLFTEASMQRGQLFDPDSTLKDL